MRTDQGHGESGTSGSLFQDAATDVVPGYRPVSVLAVFAALAGMLSVVALFSTALWTVPLVAIGLALLGLRDVAPLPPGDSPEIDGAESNREGPADRKTGRWLALLGLALAVGFGAQAVATTISHRTFASARAEAAARMFVEMLREERIADALKVCLPQVIPPSSRAGVGGIATPDVQELQAQASLADLEVVRAIQACGGSASIELRCIGPEERFEGGWVVVGQIGPCADGGRPLPLKMLMQAKPVTRGQRLFDNWMVGGIAIDKPE